VYWVIVAENVPGCDNQPCGGRNSHLKKSTFYIGSSRIPSPTRLSHCTHRILSKYSLTTYTKSATPNTPTDIPVNHNIPSLTLSLRKPQFGRQWRQNPSLAILLLCLYLSDGCFATLAHQGVGLGSSGFSSECPCVPLLSWIRAPWKADGSSLSVKQFAGNVLHSIRSRCVRQ